MVMVGCDSSYLDDKAFNNVIDKGADCGRLLSVRYDLRAQNSGWRVLTM
jgi:hypothetical protein